MAEIFVLENIGMICLPLYLIYFMGKTYCLDGADVRIPGNWIYVKSIEKDFIFSFQLNFSSFFYNTP
jgi:hypothetical protein